MARALRSDIEDDYAPLEAPDFWPVVSLLCFAAALGSRLVVRLLPAAWRPYPWGALLPVAASLVFAFAGVLAAWFGLRRSAGGQVARLALWLNVVVGVLTALAAAAMVWIFRR